MKATFYILIMLLISCKILSVDTSKGEYSKRGKDFSYNLIINEDSTFTLTKKYIDVFSQCEGKWQFLSDDTLLLKCNKEPFPAQLSGGYMSDRKKKVIVLSKKKLKLGQVVMKRIK